MAFGNISAMMIAHHHIGILKIEEAELDIYFIDLNNWIYNIVLKNAYRYVWETVLALNDMRKNVGTQEKNV